MDASSLKIIDRPALSAPRMVMGFTGWMDGGDVSTGTIDYLGETLEATRLAEIDPDPFYILNFPGSMEIAALFRPLVKIEEGRIRRLAEPMSVFLCNPDRNLILFKGKEPNLCWRQYADCLFEMGREFGVREAYFVGSVAGLVPHTRDPRIFGSVSEESLLDRLQRYGLTPSDYEGPASFVTYFTHRARREKLPVMALVAEIPAYVQGKNPKCIAALAGKLAAMLGMDLDMTALRNTAKEFEKRINETVRKRPELADEIRKIERDYDRQVFGRASDEELKAWLEKQGIRLD